MLAHDPHGSGVLAYQPTDTRMLNLIIGLTGLMFVAVATGTLLFLVVLATTQQ